MVLATLKLNQARLLWLVPAMSGILIKYMNWLNNKWAIVLAYTKENWKDLLAIPFKLVWIMICAWLVYCALIGFSRAVPDDDYTTGSTYPY